MKRSLIALAVLGSVSTIAAAQSSVTLFGIVDVNARSVSNNFTQKSLSTDGNASSRLGFRGVEDLGGGLKAGFWLEGALTPDDGTAGGQQWRRRSTLSLMGNWGEIRVGRDYSPTFWNWTSFDPFGTNGVGSSTNLGLEGGATQGTGGSYGTLVRVDNSVGYFLPGGLGGIYGQAMVSAGEGTFGNKLVGGRIGWQGGPFNVAAAYAETEATATQDAKVYNVAGAFDMGFARLTGFYGVIDLAAVEQTNWFVGATVPFGAMTFKASYGSVDDVAVGIGSTASNGLQYTGVDANQLALGVVYDLSKRTALYAHYSKIENNGTAFRVAGTRTSGPGLTRGNDSDGYEFGIRHSF